MERYEVELIEQYDKLNLYSIRIDGHEYTEFEEFVLRFSDNDEYKEDLDIVLSWLDNIIRRGALERFFRPEYRYGSGISAIPIETSKIRLYCVRISNKILILGNGGIKDADKWQDSPLLSSIVNRLVDTERFIQSRKHSGKICINESGELIGNLKFTRNDDETK